MICIYRFLVCVCINEDMHQTIYLFFLDKLFVHHSINQAIGLNFNNRGNNNVSLILISRRWVGFQDL